MSKISQVRLTKTDLFTLHKLSRVFISNLEFEAITQDIVDLMVKYLGSLGGILFLVNREKNYVYSHTVSETKIIKYILKVKLTKKFQSYRLSLDYQGKQLIKDTVLKRRIYTGHDVRDFICPPVPEKIALVIQKIAHVQFSISLPVIFRGQVIGVLWLNFREERLSSNKLYLLELFADYTAIALNNANSFDVLKRQKDTLARQNIHLQKLLKMRSEFLDIASHQLRTPISTIKGYVSMLMQGDYNQAGEQEKREVYRAIAYKTEKLNQIVSDILYASELDTDEFSLAEKELQVFEISSYLQNIIEHHQMQAREKKIKLSLINLPASPIRVFASERYLKAILDNLVINALSYTREGGRVDVRIKPKKDLVRIEVRDNGIGIPKQDQKEMFQKFGRASNANFLHTDGSGLGLFIVKKMIGAHPKGKVGFKSQENKGTTIWIEIKRLES